MDIVIAIIGSSALSALIGGIIGIIQSRRGRLEKIEAELKELKKTAARTELKLMIHDYPDDISDILKMSEDYFVAQKGNWTMFNIFREWAQEKGIQMPAWARDNKEGD